MVYFVGAGPGDPELVTVKGKKIIDSADVIIYAGSLVNRAVIAEAKQDAVIYNSASMTLEEVTEVMIKACNDGKTVARVHTGDPSIFGAVREQQVILEKKGIEYMVIPGVSSFLAAAASMKKEYTLPGISQTVILSRMSGRTPVPEKENLRKLAEHRATLVLFLSISMIDAVTDILKESYPTDTPAAVIYKASQPEEKIIMGTLMDIAQKTRKQNITKTALIMVGDFLQDKFELSKLYDKTFSHEFRKGCDKI